MEVANASGSSGRIMGIPKLLTARDVMQLTGLGYERALALTKVYGVRLGRTGKLYRISEAALARALDPGSKEA